MFVTIAFIAHAASLVVDGVGEVSMEDAEQTCLTGVAQGSVREALQGTEPGQMATGIIFMTVLTSISQKTIMFTLLSVARLPVWQHVNKVV